MGPTLPSRLPLVYVVVDAVNQALEHVASEVRRVARLGADRERLVAHGRERVVEAIRIHGRSVAVERSPRPPPGWPPLNSSSSSKSRSSQFRFLVPDIASVSSTAMPKFCRACACRLLGDREPEACICAVCSGPTPGRQRRSQRRKPRTAVRGECGATFEQPRMGRPRLFCLNPACYWSFEMHRSGFGAWLWKRLRIIAVEDCSREAVGLVADVKAVCDQYAAAAKRSDGHEVLFVARAAISLATAPKSRVVDWAVWHHVNDNVPRREIPDEALDGHTLRGRRRGRCEQFFIAEASRLEPFAGSLADLEADYRKLAHRRVAKDPTLPQNP
jgi:hypothetical protein